jgi:hypothetical protein
MSIFWQILMWVGIVLGETVVVTLWLCFSFAVVGIIMDFWNRLFGNRWRM